MSYFLIQTESLTQFDSSSKIVTPNLKLSQLESDALLSDFTLDDEDFEDTFQQLTLIKNSTFSSFFIFNNIDTPYVFKQIPSFIRNKNKSALTKFVSALTKNGERERFMKFFLNVYNLFFLKNFKFPKYTILNIQNQKLLINSKFKWIDLYLLILKQFNVDQIKFSIDLKPWEPEKPEEEMTQEEKDLIEAEIDKEPIIVNFNPKYFPTEKEINLDCISKTNLLASLLVVSPIFNFFIHNVDKSKRKFSRGKSGKYTFVWKFVSFYKRIPLIVKFFKKNVKFAQGQNFKNKLFNSFCSFFLNPQKSFVWKCKIFAYNYVFKNFRYSLILNYKTIR